MIDIGSMAVDSKFEDEDIVCYCFGYTKADIKKDLLKNGKSTIGYLAKLPFNPISVSLRKIKCSHMLNMLRFYFSMLLELKLKF